MEMRLPRISFLLFLTIGSISVFGQEVNLGNRLLKASRSTVRKKGLRTPSIHFMTCLITIGKQVNSNPRSVPRCSVASTSFGLFALGTRRKSETFIGNCKLFLRFVHGR